jgi:seryl-tRNA(Sec) selenium transferase
MDSVGLVFSPERDARQLMRGFRALRPPVIGRIENDCLILDLKTVDESDIPYLIKAIRKVIKQQA